MKKRCWLVTLLTLLLLPACSADRLPDAEPMPSGASFAGVWYSTQFEHMYLRQSGDDVRGIYAHRDGGTLEGSLNGNLLVFEWIDPGNREQARRGLQGKGYLQLVREGDKWMLKGEWGYNENRTGGGPWTAEYVRELDPDDPRNLEELLNMR